MIEFGIDRAGVDGLGAMLRELEVTFNSPYHLNSATAAAGAVMFERFMIDTSVMAAANKAELHHVYEWNHIGELGWELFKPVLRGAGGSRSITWEWRASKTIVPTETDALGNQKFPSWFDTSKLAKVHIFVWKAPIMEYGINVTVRPKLSRVLVIPNPQGIIVRDTDSRAARSVIFTPYPYVITNPGGEARGQFTKWFAEWFATRAEAVLNDIFVTQRDNAFKRIFGEQMHGLPVGKNKLKTAKYEVDTAAASAGKHIAQLIAGELQRNYIAMAAERKRIINGA